MTSSRLHPHPKSGDLYTPLNDDVVRMLDELRDAYGTWREVAHVTGLKLKTLRRLRFKQRKMVSMALMDRIITPTAIRRVDDFVWFEAVDLVAMGIWDDVVYIDERNGRVDGNVGEQN